MHYTSTSDLPNDLQSLLPEHAQEVYREAYNSAWDTYKELDDDNDHSTRKATAHQVAVSVVKKKYRKNKAPWRKKIN